MATVDVSNSDSFYERDKVLKQTALQAHFTSTHFFSAAPMTAVRATLLELQEIAQRGAHFLHYHHHFASTAHT